MTDVQEAQKPQSERSRESSLMELLTSKGFWAGFAIGSWKDLVDEYILKKQASKPSVQASGNDLDYSRSSYELGKTTAYGACLTAAFCFGVVVCGGP